MLRFIDNMNGNVSYYDARLFDYDTTSNPAVFDMFNSSNTTARDLIYELLHVNESKKVPIWTPVSNNVSGALSFEVMTTYSKYYDELLTPKHQNPYAIPVILAAGEFDMRFGSSTLQQWFKKDLYNWPQSAMDSK